MITENNSDTGANTHFAEEASNRETQTRFLRMKSAVERAGGNHAVSEKADVGLTTLSTYMNGKEWKLGIAEKIASACNVSLQWLLFGDDPQSIPSSAYAPAKDNENISFPNYDIKLSAGHGIDVDGKIAKASVSIPKAILPIDVLDHRKNVCALTVKGDSMQPSLDDGDLVLIRTDVESIKSGAIYAIRIDNSLLVKRLRLKANGNVEVVSDNPSYSTDELKAAEIRQMIRDGGTPAKIIGRVVWRSGAMTV